MTAPQPAASDIRFRVLYVSHTAHMGGAETVLLRILPHLRHVAPTVLTPPGELADALEGAGVAVVRSRYLGKLAKSSNRLWPLAFARRFIGSQAELWRLLRRLRPDVVQANTFYATLYALLPARLRRIPLVWHMHDCIAGRRSFAWLSRLYARHVAAIVAVSRAVRDELTAVGVPGERIHVVYNSVEQRPAAPTAPPAFADDLTAFARGHHPLVGMLGTVQPEKGMLEVVQALPALRRQAPEAGVVVAGAPRDPEQERYRARIVAWAEANGVREHVLWLGKIRDVRAFFAGIDVFCHYPVFPDSLPTVVTEALLAGRPVVASRMGGNPELLDDGALGTLVPVGDPEALAAALADPPPPLTAHQQAAYLARFAPHVQEAALERIYTDIAGRASAKA